MWRDIKGFEGLYQVSNYGRVRSLGCFSKGRNNCLRFVKGRILSQIKHGSHFHVLLSKNKDKKWFEVHQLVAQAFISNPNNYEIVHHKNHQPDDNRVENLMWVSKEEHIAIHSNKRAKRAKRVDQIDPISGEVLHQWTYVKEITRELGYRRENIYKCCRNKYKTYKKYIWKYVYYENNIV